MAILIVSGIVSAQSEIPDSSSTAEQLTELDQYLKLAAEHNPRLKASYQTYQAALEKAGYAGALDDPMLSFGHFFQEVETRVGPQKEKLSLRQSFPWFGTLGNRSNLAQSQAAVVYEKYKADLLELTFELKLNYFHLLNLQQKEALLKDNEQLVDYWVGLIKTKYELGEKSHSDLLQAQIELARVQDALLSLQSEIEPVKAKLRALVNSDKYDFGTNDSFEIERLKLNEALLLDSFSLTNPNLARYDALIKANRESLALASKASYPNFSFGVDYTVTDESPMAGIEDNGKDPLMVSVGINLPLWFGKNNAKKREAQASLKSAEYAYEDLKNQLRANMVAELAGFDNNQRKYKLYQDDIIPQAQYNLELLFKSYQLGESTIFDLIRVERELLNYQTTLLDIKFNSLVTLAKVELLSNHQIY